MIRIRAAQMDVFAQIGVENLMQLIERHWPDRARDLGEVRLRAFVLDGARRAGPYGIVAEAHVARYLNLMLALGSDFDTDPGYPWAAILLSDPAMRPASKVERLCSRASRALREKEPAGR